MEFNNNAAFNVNYAPFTFKYCKGRNLKETLMTNLFDGFKLSAEMLSAIQDMGFEKPSPIQSETITPILDGRDIIGQAHTGTGKTAAYAIPAIENIDPANFSTQLLIMCPTRELVIQVEREIFKLTKYKQITFVAVYGGQQIERQFRQLDKGAQIVIGTPGRLMDHLRRGSVDISDLKTVVLDEADEMLDMGFRDDIADILKNAPKTRQTVMFSATMEDDILRLTKKFQNDPIVINVITESEPKPEIEQVYFEVASKNKAELLSRLLDFNNVKLGLIFCNTKSMVDELVENLKTKGHFADGLHGDLNQTQRERVMRKFRSGSTALLVATDVAGRGIDVSDVEAVFNYDLPRDDEDYIHRIGRTGRAGKSGKAFTFVSSKQIQHVRRIERANGQLINKGEIPTVETIEESKLNNHKEVVKSIITTGIVSSYKNFVEEMISDEFNTTDIAAALLKMLMDKESESLNSGVNFDEQDQFEEKGNKRSRNRGFRDNRGSRDGNNSGRAYGGQRRSEDGQRRNEDGQKRSGDYSGKKSYEDKKPYDAKKAYDSKSSKKKSYSNVDKKIVEMISTKRKKDKKSQKVK